MADTNTQEWREYSADEILCDIRNGEIGRGGFGSVILGKHKSIGFLAIKGFSVTGGEREQAMLKRNMKHEYDMLLKSHHDNIAHVYGFTKWSGSIGIVMQYYEGGNLKVLLLDEIIKPHLRAGLRLRFATEIATGVAHIHTCGFSKPLVHGDMKPENLLLTRDLHIKIADFGSAKLAVNTGSTTRVQGQQEGIQMTLFYAAPEKVLQGKRPKKEQDVYSCAIIYYVLLSCEMPYLSEDAFWQMIREGKHPDCDAIDELKRCCNDADLIIIEAIEKWMIMCWNNDPDLRPNMESVRDDLHEHLVRQDPAEMLEQVKIVVDKMEETNPLANNNPTTPLSHLSLSSGRFEGVSSDLQLPNATPDTASRSKQIFDFPAFVLIGGFDSERECIKYDVLTKRPEHLQSLITGRIGATAVKVGSRVYVVGGATKHWGAGQYTSCEVMDLTEPTKWHMIPPMLEVRRYCGTGSIEDCIFVTGGSNNQTLSNCEKFNIKGNKWTGIKNMLHARSQHACVVCNDLLYCIGGSDGSKQLSSCERYDVRSDVWNEIAPLNQARSGLACVVLDGNIYAIGGLGENGPMSTVEQYIPEANKWEQLLPQLQVARCFSCSCVLDNKIFVIGGTNNGKMLSSVEVWSSETNVWSTSFETADPVFAATVVPF